MSDTEAEVGFDSYGNLRVGFTKMVEEDYAILEALNNSPYWKHYRNMLIKAKKAHFNATMGFDDPSKVMKHMGMVTGINFAINQLPIILAHHKQVVAKKQKEAENKAKPKEAFKRG